MKKKIFILATLLTLMIGCELLNMINCKYKVDSLSNPTWAGVNFANIKQLSDINIVDGIKVAQAILNKDYNLKFDFNILAANQTENPAKILGFDYRLLLNETELTNGESPLQYSIAPGQSTTIPIIMSVNIKDFISGENIQNLVNLTTNLMKYGRGEPSDVTVQFAPYIPVGKETRKMPYITLNQTFQ